MSTGGMDIGAMVQGTTGLVEIGVGIFGGKETREKIDELRKKYPKMSIPEAITQATELYKQGAQSSRLPGHDLYEQQIGASTAQGIARSREVATSAADLLGATTSLYGQQSQALTNLEIEGARQQAQNRQLYGQQLNTLGQWQHQQYITNELIPWQTRMNELQGTSQGFYDMLTGGINTLAASGANMSGGGSAPQTASTDISGQDVSGYGMNYQPTTQAAGGNQTLGQYQYNPGGGQTLGQYIYS
jgi:hypothetical protein